MVHHTMPWQLRSAAGIFLVLSLGSQKLEASPTAPQGVCSEGLECTKKKDTVTLGLLSKTKTRPYKSKMFQGEGEQLLVEHAEDGEQADQDGETGMMDTENMKQVSEDQDAQDGEMGTMDTE